MKKFLLSIFAVLFAFAGVYAQSYVKVTSAPVDWSGDYLIVYEAGNVAFNGGLSTLDATSNTISVTISDGKILATDATNAAKFTIVSNGDGTYTVKSASGYYIGRNSAKNGLDSSNTTAYTNTITYTDGKVVIASSDKSDYSLQYNKSSGQTRFRYFGSAQEAIALYKYTDGVAKAATPTVVGGEFVGSKTVTITNNSEAEGATVYYTMDGGEIEQFTGASKEFTIVKNTTIVAYAQIGDDEETRSATVTAEFTRVAANPVLVYDATSFDDEITVSVTSEDDVYYTLDGTKPNAESTPYEGALTLKATATLKVIAIDADDYASAVVEQEFTKNAGASAASETTLVTDASTLAVGDQIVIVASDYDYALSTTQNDNNRGQASVTKDGNNITYGANVQIITLEEGSVDGTFAFNVGTGYLYAASSSKNYLRTNANLDNNGSWTVSVTDGIASIIAQGSNTRNMMQYNQTSSIFSCYASDKPQKDISIYKINKASIEAYTLSVSAAGWATLFLNYDAEIPAGVTCYAVSAVDGEYAKLAEVEGVIPANTGVIVEANEGSYTFEVATEEGSDVVNELIGTTVNTYITKEAYVLGIVDDVVGLYKAEMAGGVWLNNANKAYLPASVANGIASYSFRFGEGTTGIDQITDNREQSTVIYDLTGRRVEAITTPGIYVVNGKKVLVK